MKLAHSALTLSLAVVTTGVLAAPASAATDASPSPDQAAAAAEVDPATTDQLASVSQQLLQSRADELVADQAPISASTRLGPAKVHVKAAQREAELRGRVEDNRTWLNQRSEAYTRATTTIESPTATRDGATITIRANEVTFLDYAKIHGDEPPNTGYTAQHEFVYIQDDSGTWTLLEDRQLEPTGLLPLREAVTYVQGNPGLPNSTEQAPAGQGGRPASTKLATDRAPKTAALDPLAAGYNYAAMATYLEKYWSSYNPAYRSFAGAGNGGDCTNFASQALRAGGWGEISGWYRDPSYWWYNSLNQTWSWTSVNHLSTFGFERGRFTSLSNVWSLGLGDVLQIDGTRDGSKDHTMMVSYKTSSSPYFTYHSTNRYRRSMQTVLNDWGAAWYYADRT